MRVWGFGGLGGVFRPSVHGLGLRFSGWLVRGAGHTGHCTPDGMSLVSCTGYAVLTLMRVGFAVPAPLPWGWGAMHPLPVVVLRVCLGTITRGKAL